MKALRILLYLVYLGAFALALDYFAFWRPFVAELRERERPRDLEIAGIGAAPKELMQQVGAFAQDRDSSFTRFDERKPAGVTRVCAFGDSFTYGDEVAENADYPSRLDHALRTAGIRDVEVLNFGSPWHGFHQSAVLWEQAGKRYGCDVTLLGPASFWEARDVTFNHSDLISPYYLHARYVLEGGDVRLVGVQGDDFAERFERYWSFFPRWRYLRYDRNAPAFLRAPIPGGRKLRNPFYYRRDSEGAEAMATWRILLARIAQAGKPVFLSGIRDDIVEMARSIESQHLIAVPAWQEHRFPYKARQGHNSVWGNQVIAAQFAALLLRPERRAGRGSPDQGIAGALCSNRDALGCHEPSSGTVALATSGHGEDAAAVDVGARRALSDYTSITLEISRLDAGRLVTASPDFWARGQGRPGMFYGSDRLSLLAIVSPEESLVDAAFLALAASVRGGEPLRVLVASSEATTSALRLLHPKLPIGVVESASIRFRGKEELVWVGTASDGARVEVSLGDLPILEGEVEGGEAVLRVSDGQLLQATAARTEPFDVAALPSTGSVDLILDHAKDGALRVPLSRWRKVQIRFAQPD